MKKYIALALIATVAMGCNNDKAEFNPNEIRVEAKMPTRATLSSFEVGDKMSLYAVEYDGEIVPEVQTAGNYINNEPMTYDGAKWSSGRTLYWSEKPCDFYGFYPYQPTTAMSNVLFDIDTDDFYCAILPTATQYARNALFAGLMPLAIDKLMPDKWLNDNEDGGKNMYEEEFLRRLITQAGKRYKLSFDKLVRPEAGRKLLDNMQHIYDADFSVIIYNFLDILSHARTETDIIRDLTDDEASFRSLTRSWFEHSELYTLLKMLSERGHKVIITSDHGTIRVDNPVRVTGDKETSANLRYKTGRNLAYNARDVYEVTRPEDVQLPSGRLTSSYIFAYNRDFLVYNNDANKYIRYYKNTFQHGGISMEEMIVPYAVLKPKNK